MLHRDIKPANIFLTRDLTVKLGDFGVSKKLDHTKDHGITHCGTYEHMAPEVYESKPYDTKSDIWSVGTLFYLMMTLQDPFPQ